MMRKLAQLISVVTHPIFLPTWMFLIFMATGLCELALIREDICLAIVFATTFVMPALSLLLLKKIKIIKSITMERREDRFIPLFVMVIFLYATSRFFNGIITLGLYNFYLICNMLLCVVVFWINIYWKISMHGIGWGALSATLFIMTTVMADIFLPYFVISILASGVVGTARLYLKSHSASQVYAGFAVGFMFVVIMYSVLL